MIFTNISRLCKKTGVSIAKLERETGLERIFSDG